MPTTTYMPAAAAPLPMADGHRERARHARERGRRRDDEEDDAEEAEGASPQRCVGGLRIRSTELLIGLGKVLPLGHAASTGVRTGIVRGRTMAQGDA